MNIEFDSAKNSKNIEERHLSFERAADFDFTTAVTRQDNRKRYPEARFVALGFLEAGLHVLCFTPINNGIRVISFCRANRREIRDYEQTPPTH